MKRRILVFAVIICTASLSGAFEWTGLRFVSGTLKFQLGDICDSVRFPLTPGDCSGSAGNPDWKTEFTDVQALDGDNRYYVRVVQADGNMAWASPIWVELKR